MKKTIRVLGMIHEGSLGKKAIKQLESVIRSTYHAHFGVDYKLLFVWMSLPKGQAYLAGKPSTASTIQIPVDDGMPSEKRHPFMSEICSKWQYITGCNKNEIILNSSDASQAQAHFEATTERLNESSKKWTQVKLLGRLTSGYLTKGYLNTHINF